MNNKNFKFRLLIGVFSTGLFSTSLLYSDSAFSNSIALNSSVQNLGADFTTMAIYGEDNRIEPYDSTPMQQELSQSVAGRFSPDHLVSSGAGYTVQRKTLGQEKCSGIRFAEQTLGPTCSGFLVKPDVLVTAGHCMNEVAKCTDNVWAFDYALKGPKDQGYKSISKNNVYRCKKIIAQKYANFGDIDYAIIQLDRPVTDRKILEMDFETKPEKQSFVFAAGYPSGLPMKVTTQGQVLRNESVLAFDTDLDIFQGNSGSPVFDAITGKVLGITSHGHEDYIRDGGSSCKKPRVCRPEDNCYLSTASRISNLAEEFNKIGSQTTTSNKSELSINAFQKSDTQLDNKFSAKLFSKSNKLKWPRRKGVVLYKLKANSSLQNMNLAGLGFEGHAESIGSNIFEAHINSLMMQNSSSELSEEAFAKKLKASGKVEFAEPDYIFYPDMLVNDPISTSQWYLEKLGLNSTWDTATGSNDVKVLVCDTGVSSNHSDLKENVSLEGLNFVDNSKLTEPNGNPHGTQVSGLIGAKGNNGIGIAGINWNIKVIPGKITNDPKGATLTSTMVKCVQWAVDNNIRLVNLSYNGGGSEAINEVAKNLYDHNGLLVLTIGNTGEEVNYTPNPYMIRVGAVDFYDFKAYWSNTGKALDIVAPGTSMYTTDANGDYKRVQGTSFSAPMVTGTAALLLSINPQLTNAQLRSLILDSAKDLGKPGFDPAFGNGRLDVANAVKMLKQKMN